VVIKQASLQNNQLYEIFSNTRLQAFLGTGGKNFGSCPTKGGGSGLSVVEASDQVREGKHSRDSG
jgi:hypothetical protein